MFASSLQLKKLRQYLNLTQDEFAEKIKTKRNSISMIESGRNKPTFEMIAEISKAFNISSDYFLGEFGVESFIDNNVNISDKKDNNNVIVNVGNDVTVKSKTAGKNGFFDESEFVNFVYVYIEKINYLYQRLIDIRVLLYQELKIKGDFASQSESELYNALTKPKFVTNEGETTLHYPYQNLDNSAKTQYIKKLENCIDLFTNTFFENFKQLYKGIRIPVSTELRKEFIANRAKLTGEWKYSHVLKA